MLSTATNVGVIVYSKGKIMDKEDGIGMRVNDFHLECSYTCSAMGSRYYSALWIKYPTRLDFPSHFSKQS